MKELKRCRILVVGTEMKLIGARGDQGLNTDEQKLGHREKGGLDWEFTKDTKQR